MHRVTVVQGLHLRGHTPARRSYAMSPAARRERRVPFCEQSGTHPSQEAAKDGTPIAWLCQRKAGPPAGSVFHLPKVLGHSSLEMTRRYANLVTEDLQAVQERVSLLSSR